MDYNLSKNMGDKNPIPKGSHLLGIGGKKIYDPEGVAQASFRIFADVVSRRDTDGEKY